ncbi:peptidoglycan-binding protein [Roseibium sp.]|uniref:peptidoglycan-binding protein n=1 Tax=Roseibium sp. TaxID=1936156 RepID=UPI003B52B0AC
MPARNKHEAGRRGRVVYDSLDRNDLPHREAPRARIERLTRTATALGGYDRGHDADIGSEEDLDAVADELDRLLSERSDRPAARPPKKRRPRHAPRREREPVREAGLEDVMGALDRLDRQVQGLSEHEDYEDEYDRAPRGHRAGRYAIDSLDDHHDHMGDDVGYYDDHGYEDHRYQDEEDYAYRREPRRTGPSARDASMHVYKDLGRRIDALRKPQEKALAHVREELGSLRDALGGLANGTNETVSRQNAELRRLTDMVERLRNDKRNDQLAKDIRKEVADLKSLVGQTNVEGTLQTLEHGYAHILQRLDELSRASVDPRVLRGVTMRLNEIEDAFAALPRSEHMMVLEDRVVSIAERMEELLQRKDHEEIEPLRTELREVRGFVQKIDIKGLVESIDDRMKFVSSRLDDLETLAKEQRGLDSRLSAMEERMPEPETINRLQGRLEDIVGMMADDRAAPADQQHLIQVDQRLDDIVDRLERMEQTPPLPSSDSGAFQALEKRLEAISGKIDVIEKRAARPVPVLDAAAMRSGNGPDAKFMAQIQDRLNDLTNRLDQPSDSVTTSDLDKLRAEITAMRERVAEPASTDALEQRISDLANLVSKGGGAADDRGLEILGSKVAALAEQIENTSSTAQNSDQFASVLERIESGLAQTRSDVAGIARKAAEEAVANTPASKNPQYDTAISSLQSDLKRLLDAAEGSDERTRNTFDGVKSVLGSITERLDTLERVERPVADKSEPAADSGNNMFSPIKVAERPPLFAKAQPDKADIRGSEETSAQEPAAPEMSARDRKADFIAAARRAAQAASAEAAQLEKNKPETTDEADEERGKARVGWLRNVLKRSPSADDEAQQDREFEAGGTDQAGPETDDDRSPVLAGDRVAPEPAQASGGRRRAILYTAAAVVLLMAGFYVTRGALLPSDTTPQIAAVPQENATEGTAVPGVDMNAAPAATAPADNPEVSSAPIVGESPPAQVASVAAEPAADAPVATPSNIDPPAVAATDPTTAPVPAAASAPLQPETGLAFAPPSGVENSFSAAPAGATRGFAPSQPATSTETPAAPGLLASLPPEEVGSMALRSAAASGNSAAEFLIGVKYTEGDGVQADLAKAAVWYQKAADKGLAPAQYRLASLYEKGRGVTKDLPKAKAWYMKSAEAGNAKAMHNLAVLFAEGGGDQPDYAAAAKWFEAAANYGVKDSLFNLGILYAGGIGVDKNLIASYKWFAIAADQGDPEAAKRRDDVANMMDQETLANARLAVENFKLKTPVAAANKVTLQPDWTDGQSLPASKASIKAVDNSAMIREAQDKLNYLGFDTGTPDGQMGPRTRSAIRAFQRSLGLPETGEVDGRLIDELKSQAI